jgi:transcriptional regulator with XRE-family HTH domain
MTDDQAAKDYGKRIQKAVRAQIRAEIAARGLKRADVAAAAGLYGSTLSRYLSDTEDRAIPVDVLGQLAFALGLDPITLVSRADRRLREDEGDGDDEPEPGVA